MPTFASNLKTNRNVCSAAITDLRWILPNSIFYVFGFFTITTTYKGALVSYSAIPVIPNHIGRYYRNNRFCT